MKILEASLGRPFPAYKGDKPYVFVSYSHKDTAMVFPELARLNESGFNIWYDEGIEAGTEWTDELAKAIEGASLFLYFVTPESVGSQICRNEVNFAVEHGLAVIAVYLKKTELPGGLSLTLSSRQAIHKYELRAQEYEEKLNQRISSYLNQAIVLTATTSQRNKTSLFRVAVAGLVLVVLAWFVYYQSSLDEVDVVDSSQTDIIDDENLNQKPYVLVVPFDVSTTDVGKWRPFTDQVTREVIRNLRKVSGLRIVPAPSAFAFSENKTRLYIRTRVPNVRYLLDGLISIEPKGNVRISLTLEDLQNDNQVIWDDTHFTHANNTDLFSVQTEIARSVSNSLKVAILDSEEADLNRFPTDDIEAYALYSEGLEYQRLDTNEGYILSIERFNSAIQRDPNFVQAHIEKAQSFRQRMTFFEPPVEMERHVLAAATDAIAIDPDSAEARSTLGFSYLQSWRWQLAWRYLRDAKSRDPRIGVTHLGLALYYTALGDRQRAFSALAEADDRDPLNPEIAQWGLFIFSMFRDDDLGMSWAKEKAELFPNFTNVTINVGLLYSILGDHEKALVYLERGVRQSDRAPMPLIFLAQAYARDGKIAEARETVEEVEEIESYVCPYETATVYTALGDLDHAFDLLDTAVGFRSNCLTFTRQDPRLEPLHDDLRFPVLLEKVGLDDETIREYPR